MKGVSERIDNIGQNISKNIFKKQKNDFSILNKKFQADNLYQHVAMNRERSRIRQMTDGLSKNSCSTSKRNDNTEFMKKRMEKETYGYGLTEQNEKSLYDIKLSILKQEKLSDVSETKKSYYMSPQFQVSPSNMLQTGDTNDWKQNERSKMSEVSKFDNLDRLTRFTAIKNRVDVHPNNYMKKLKRAL